MSEFDDLARELHATRAEPRPEFVRELDGRAAGWLRGRPRRRLPSLRLAIPAAAAASAAAVVIALAISGGDEERTTSALEVAVVQDQGAAEALGAPLGLEKQDSAARAEGGFAMPAQRRPAAGDPVIVRYFLTSRAEVTVALAGRKAELEVPQGAGRIEIATDGLPAGTHELAIAGPAMPRYRERIEIGG